MMQKKKFKKEGGEMRTVREGKRGSPRDSRAESGTKGVQSWKFGGEGGLGLWGGERGKGVKVVYTGAGKRCSQEKNNCEPPCLS